MYRGLFRYLSALLVFVLYVAAMVGGDVVALTCECRYHNKADVHTDFNHVHKCSLGCSSHHAEEHAPECEISVIDEACSCYHDHSTEVALYTYPRLNDDSLRQIILLAVLANAEIELESSAVTASYDYNAGCPHVLLAGYVGNSALRAPPQLV